MNIPEAHTARRETGGNMTEQAREVLLKMIHSRQLLPGEILEERRLAEVLGVSRTPLRAALNVLEGRGLLVRLPNRGLQVAEIGIEEYMEIIHLRRLLESEAAALAAAAPPVAELNRMKQRIGRCIAREKPSVNEHLAIDFELHDLIAAAAGNKRLRWLIDDLHRRARLCKIERMPTRIIGSGREHLVMIDALLSGDAEKSRAAMATHIENVKRNFLDQLGKF